MCSIFGFIARADRKPDLDQLEEIVAANIHRGPHAFGFAWMDETGRINQFKCPGNLVSMINYLDHLRKDGRLSPAVLLSHQVMVEDPNRPFRFTFSASWTSAKQSQK